MALLPGKTKLGFIGTGVMGCSMAGHLLDAGYAVHVYNRTRAKAEPLLHRGAVWAETPGEAADGADAVITMVGYPRDVEETYFGENGVFSSAKQGAIVIDMTTSSPKLAVRIAKHADSAGLYALDAPVSGGDIGARDARLTIMVGGDADALEQAMPILQCMGTSIVHQGAPGAGQHTKMCNQIVVASTTIAVSEAISYAQQSGLDPERVLDSISTGAASSWTLTNLAPRMLKDDMEPGFYIKHFIKDLQIALDSAREMDLELPGLQLAKRLYDELSSKGADDLGTQALIRWYQARSMRSV